MLNKYTRAIAFAAMACLPAFTASAARLGKPGVSAKGATGAATQWNLISDPAYASIGSDTTLYTLNATLAEVDPVTPYQLTVVTVELTDGEGDLAYNRYFPNSSGGEGLASGKGTNGDIFIDPSTFDGMKETGRVQVAWNIMSGKKQTSATDDNTDILRFNQAPGTSNHIATFTDTMVYYGNSPYAPDPDFYSGIGANGKPFTYSTDPNSPFFVKHFDSETAVLVNIAPTQSLMHTNVFSASPAPEPSSLALAGLLSGAGLLRRKRR